MSINSLNIYGQSKLFQACLNDKYHSINEILNDSNSDVNVNLVEKTSKNSPLHILVERAQFAQAIEKAQIKAQQELDDKIEEIEAGEGDDVYDLKIEKLKKKLGNGEIDKEKMNKIIESIKKSKQKKEKMEREGEGVTGKNSKKKSRSADDLRSSKEEVIKITDLIEKLITLNADLQAKSDSGWTALNKAIYLASDLPEYPLEVLPLLLDGCRALNVPARRNTPLHFAAGSRIENGQRALLLVNMLIKKCGNKLDYQATNSNGWTPYKVALSVGNMEVAKILASKTSLFSFSLIGLILTIIFTGLLGFLAFYVYKYKFSKTEPLAQTEEPVAVTDEKTAGVGDEVSVKSTQSPPLDQKISTDTDNSDEKED